MTAALTVEIADDLLSGTSDHAEFDALVDLFAAARAEVAATTDVAGGAVVARMVAARPRLRVRRRRFAVAVAAVLRPHERLGGGRCAARPAAANAAHLVGAARPVRPARRLGARARAGADTRPAAGARAAAAGARAGANVRPGHARTHDRARRHPADRDPPRAGRARRAARPAHHDSGRGDTRRVDAGAGCLRGLARRRDRDASRARRHAAGSRRAAACQRTSAEEGVTLP